MNTCHTHITPIKCALPAEQQAGHPSGSWHLAGGHALRLHGKQAAVLRITAGRVWATLDGPYNGPANNQGDLVLSAGEQMTLPAGRGVVIEPWSRPARHAQAQADAFFSWEPALAAGPVSALTSAPTGSRLQQAVGDPLRELGLALWRVAQALGHLAAGVAGLGEFLVAGRGRVLPRLESNPP